MAACVPEGGIGGEDRRGGEEGGSGAGWVARKGQRGGASDGCRAGKGCGAGARVSASVGESARGVDDRGVVVATVQGPRKEVWWRQVRLGRVRWDRGSRSTGWIRWRSRRTEILNRNGPLFNPTVDDD